MGSSENNICSEGWWNHGRSLFPPCAAPLNDFMWSSSSISTAIDELAEMKQATAAIHAYSRSDDQSDDHHSSSAEHLPIMTSDYAQIFQHTQKPLMADFGISDWLQNSLLNDSSNMPIFKLVTDNNQRSNNSQGFYNLDDHQFDTNAKVSDKGLGNNTSASSYAHSAILQTDMNCVFDNSFVASATDYMQQQPPVTANPPPYWDSWMSSDEIGTPESNQLSVPAALFEDRKPYKHSGNSSLGGNTMIPKIENKDMLQTKRKNTSDESYKRPRIETPSCLPTFKVRKEKLGDRITALQQLVSPFGKTDTASVLHEAVEYIKFLHDQVLRTPYMQNGTPTNQHQQMQGEPKNTAKGPKQDLRSRGLCLVPISSTFPVANETTSDFWTPTFGGTMAFR